MPRQTTRAVFASLLLAIPPLAACGSSSVESPTTPSTVARTTARTSTAAAAKSGAASPQEADVIAALKGYETAITAEDTIALKQIWADDYTFINPQGGIVTKADRLANITSGATSVVEGVNQREIVVHVYGDNAVVTQRFTLRGTFSGVVTDREVRGSFTWIKRAGRWQLVFNEITPVIP